MRIKTTPYLAAWRTALVTLSVNLLLSCGIALLGISDVHMHSLIVSICFTIFALCLMLFAARKDLSTNMSEMGFRGFNPRLIPLLITVPVASQFFCDLLVMPIAVVARLLLGNELSNVIAQSDLPTAFAYLCILAPISEEIIFRGVIYRYLEKHSSLAAIFLSAIMFSMAHFDLRTLAPIFFIGLVLSLIRFSTGSIFASMLAHSAVNLFALVILYTSPSVVIQLCAMAALVMAFPFCIARFIKTMPKKELFFSGAKKGVSVCMIVVIAMYVAVQGYAIAINLSEKIQHYNGNNFYNDMPYTDKFGFDIEFD